jgi:hypothetical protein
MRAVVAFSCTMRDFDALLPQDPVCRRAILIIFRFLFGILKISHGNGEKS